MAALDAVMNFGNSILGKTAKAILVIHTKSAETVNSAQVSGNTAGVLSAASQLAGGISAGANLLAGGGTGNPIAPGPHIMHVQYNPSSLSIQANTQPIPFRYLQSNMDEGVPNQALRPPMVVLSVDLIFDDMNPQDAFMAQKLNLSLGSLVSDVAGAVKNLKGKGYTVQPQTDALMATMLRQETRTATFRWADMAFTGQICQIQAEYTMFSPSGKPVRSKVQLQIAQQVESAADTAYWDKAFSTIFKDGSLGGGKSAGQKLGNLINLNNF